VAAKKNAKIGIAARGGSVAGNSVASGGTAGGAPWRGRISQFNGAASSIFRTGPDQAGRTPAPFVQEDGAQWPTDRAGKPGYQGDTGDRAARLVAVEPGQCGKGRIVKTHADADAEQRPGNDESRSAMGRGEDHQAGSDDQVRGGENTAPAMPVDQPPH
jgi:hypothetical protein